MVPGQERRRLGESPECCGLLEKMASKSGSAPDNSRTSSGHNPVEGDRDRTERPDYLAAVVGFVAAVIIRLILWYLGTSRPLP